MVMLWETTGLPTILSTPGVSISSPSSPPARYGFPGERPSWKQGVAQVSSGPPRLPFLLSCPFFPGSRILVFTRLLLDQHQLSKNHLIHWSRWKLLIRLNFQRGGSFPRNVCRIEAFQVRPTKAQSRECQYLPCPWGDTTRLWVLWGLSTPVHAHDSLSYQVTSGKKKRTQMCLFRREWKEHSDSHKPELIRTEHWKV